MRHAPARPGSGAERSVKLSGNAARMNFEAFFSLSPNPYVVLDTDLCIVWMNDAYLKATMSTREEIAGRNMFDAFPSEPGTESHDLLHDSLMQVVRTGKPDELALIRYDIRGPDGTMQELYWSATHTPLCGEDGRTRYILQHTVDVTELHGLRRMRDQMGLVQRAGAVQARNADLKAQTDRLRRLVEQAPGFVAVVEGPGHVFQMANAAYRQLIGRQDINGRSVAEAVPEVVEQGFVRILDQVLDTGKPYFGRDEEVFFEIDGKRQQVFLEFIFQPIFEDGGDATGIFIQGYDVTEQIRARHRQELLISELNHRVKNTLAVVQGLASQSFRKIDTDGEARRTFAQRLHALSSAHDLLTRENWQSALLADTLTSAISAATGDDIARFDFSGPPVTLTPQIGVALAMTIHELCTNAIKYGALAAEDGRVAVDWSAQPRGDDTQRLTISWRETGGPPVEKPDRSGFGTRLIEQGFVTQHDGSAELDYRREGLHCTIELTLPAATPRVVPDREGDALAAK